jgi:hypothetical protein
MTKMAKDMIDGPAARNLSDDQLWREYSNTSPPPGGARANEVLAAEIDRRKFQAMRSTIGLSNRIAWLTFWLIIVGLLQASATAWPYLVWWVTHDFRLK